MSDKVAGLITLVGIGGMLAIAGTSIPGIMTIGLAAVAVIGVVGLCAKGDKDA